MARTTFQGAIDELESLLVTSGTTPHASLSAAGVTHVLDHEPGAEGVPSGVTLTLSPGWIEPTDWGIRLRVYISDRPAKAAQDLMVAVAVAVESRVRSNDGFQPVRTDMGWQPELGCWLVTEDVMVGREDAF